MRRRVGLVVVFVAAALMQTVSAQWLNYPTPGIPRLPNGKPDLSGVWHTYAEPLEEKKRLFGPDFGAIFVPGMEPTTISKYAINLLLDYKPGEITMTPSAEALFKLHNSGDPAQDFGAHCLPFAIPLATLLSEVHKIVQTPGLILVMYELDSMTRQIYTDGRKLPAKPSPSWLGYSAGRWDRDTLVVETNGLNDRAWLDLAGHPRSEAMRVTERHRRRDTGHLDVEITLDDPKMYSKPFTVKLTHLLQADTDILEYVCTENEKDRAHMTK
jgi:hypothetical protein